MLESVFCFKWYYFFLLAKYIDFTATTCRAMLLQGGGAGGFTAQEYSSCEVMKAADSGTPSPHALPTVTRNSIHI